MTEETSISKTGEFIVPAPPSSNFSRNKNSSISRRFRNLIHKLEKSVSDNKNSRKLLSTNPAISTPANSTNSSSTSSLSIAYKSTITPSTFSSTTPSVQTSSVSVNQTHPNNSLAKDESTSLKSPTYQANLQKVPCHSQSSTFVEAKNDIPNSLPQNQNQKQKQRSYTAQTNFATENEPIFIVGDLNRARNTLPKFAPIPELPDENGSVFLPIIPLDTSKDHSVNEPNTLIDEISISSDHSPKIDIHPTFFVHVSGYPLPDALESKHTVHNLSNHPSTDALAEDTEIEKTSKHLSLQTNTSDSIEKIIALEDQSTKVQTAKDHKHVIDTEGLLFNNRTTNLSKPSEIISPSTAVTPTKPSVNQNSHPSPATTNDLTNQNHRNTPSPSFDAHNSLQVVGQSDHQKPIYSDNHSVSSSQTSTGKSRAPPVYSAHEFCLNKYGKTTKIIGKGTGGTVHLLQSVSIEQRPPSTRNTVNHSHSDHDHVYLPGRHKLFAVKEFRKRRSDETQRVYMKKVTSEFCIGSSLHHENIIETLDLIFEGEKVFEIMEYCPFDLFKFVAKGETGLDATFCWFKQICQGVSFIHSVGIAHRDLKLENIMVTYDGVVKLIDFGCATVFKAPFQKSPNKLTGVYGSDPYIAPEVFSNSSPYDAEAADVWSVGIMYVCMMLLKFPWRFAKKDSDTNFASYVNNWPKGHDKLFAQMPAIRNETGDKLIRNLLNPDPSLRPSLADLLKSDWAQNIEICRPSKSAKRHSHNLEDN
ncbi:hypothetical protein BB560_003021 [Smittium megazygosporum]|uniref:Protein kinase domain-containing protein n=1 Tax=Smittium megazygosporum TaxID=133381 RepID=A0A2T9ZD86_9FUNG|nr:hypothetical protein BB560_003021 [Smittium megazygosporum]